MKRLLKLSLNPIEFFPEETPKIDKKKPVRNVLGAYAHSS